MLTYGTIFGNQCGLIQRCLADDKAIEGIPSPRLLDGKGNNLLEGFFPDTQADSLGEVLHNRVAGLCCPSSLVQILQFQ